MKRVKSKPRLVEREIFIADDDRTRLTEMLRRGIGGPQAQYLSALAGEICRARVVPRIEIPPDVVTMNSTVRLLDLETGEDETYTLTYPEESDIEENKISILAPIGTALLGYRAGDEVEWLVPAGVRRFRVEEVLYQPESASVSIAG
jgi:regulator of nucleoside diphosphate kinase